MTTNLGSRRTCLAGVALAGALGLTLNLTTAPNAFAAALPGVESGPLLWLAAGPVADTPTGNKDDMPRAARRAPAGERQFDLPPAKADALFALLAPDDVKVRVSRRPDGLIVQGTPQEAAALERFVELLMRQNGKSGDEVRALVDKQSADWGEPKTFALPAPAADRLLELLAIDDVPVLVERTEDGISVQADAKDLRTINQVAQIATGRRLGTRHDQARGPRPPRQPPSPPRPPERAERQEALTREFLDLRARLEHELARLHEEAERVHRQLAEQLERLERELAAITAEYGEPPHKRAPRAPALEPIVRTYRLPAPHAQNLLQLLAPDDVTDVIVSIDGNTLTVRANPQDQETIERLVELLMRKRGRVPAAAQF